jgi:hypothetical protein
MAISTGGAARAALHNRTLPHPRPGRDRLAARSVAEAYAHTGPPDSGGCAIPPSRLRSAVSQPLGDSLGDSKGETMFFSFAIRVRSRRHQGSEPLVF